MPVLRLYHRATDLSLKAGSALAANHPGVKVRGCVRLAWEYSVCVFACVRVVRVHTPCARDHMPLGARRRPLPRTPACALPSPCVPPLLQWPTHLVSRLCGLVNTPLCARLLVRAREWLRLVLVLLAPHVAGSAVRGTNNSRCWCKWDAELYTRLPSAGAFTPRTHGITLLYKNTVTHAVARTCT
jgi:hypothetical protein